MPVRDMPPVLRRETIEEMARKIAERFHPERIILFGSYARGEATENSDLDLLVVTGGSGPRRDTAVPIIRALGDEWVFPVDVIVCPPEELDRFGDVIGTLAHEVLSEGVVLYER